MPVPGVRPGAIKSAEAKPAPSLKNLPTAPVRTQAPRNIVATRQNPAFGPVIGTKGKLISSKATRPGLPVKPSGHALFSLHTLGEAAGSVVHGAESALHATYGQGSKTGKPETSKEVRFPGAAIAAPVRSTELVKGLGTAVKNLPQSTVNTIVGTVPALVETGKAGVEAIKGHPEELAKIAKGAGEVFNHPWTSFQKNPVGTGLMFYAPEEGVGRAAGAFARSGAAGSKAADAASMARSPLYIYGRHTGASTDQLASGLHDVAIPRTYSPNVIRKGAQVASENFKRNVLKQNPNIATAEQANRHLYGGGLLGQYAFRGRLQGALKPGLVDIQAGTGEMMRRLYSNSSAKLLHDIKPKHGAEAVPLAVEGVLRRPETLTADLAKEHARLTKAAAGLTGREAKLNKANIKQIEALQNDKQFRAKPEPAFQAAGHYAATMRPIEERLVHLGHLEPDQLNARNVPYAMAHMGAKYNLEPGLHPLVGQVAAAKTEVSRAEKAVQRTKGHVEGRAFSSTVLPVSKTQQAARTAIQRLQDARAERDRLEGDLNHLKLAGAIKNSGEQYPRLERNGQRLSHAEVEAHMAANLGDRNVGFLTHKAEQSYGKALQSYAGKRPGTEIRRRTGVAFEHGTYGRTYEDLRRQGYANMNALAGHENFDEMLRRFGIGRFHTPEDAKRALDNFVHTAEGERLQTGLGKMTVQRIGPERVIRRGNVDTRLLGPAAADFGVAVHKAINEVAGTPHYTLLPEAVAKRISQHDRLNNPGGLRRMLQWYTGKFRSAKLFTSPRWLLGNPQEHAIRLAFASVNPFGIFGVGKAVHLGRDIISKFETMASDPSLTEAQRYAARAQVGSYHAGTHYGSLMVNDVHRELKDPNMAGVGHQLGSAFDESRPVSAMVQDWNRWKSLIGKGMGRVEQNTQAAMVGHAALQQTRKFTSDWRALITRQDAAVHKFAEGKLSANEAVSLGNDVLEAAGNWAKLTPNVREAVQTITPFGLWWLNSMKFVFRTLPRDHPFKVAAIAAMEAGTGQEAKLEEGKSYLAGGIGLKLPVVGAITTTPGYYTPFGIGMEPAKTAGEQVIPQIGGPLFSLGGVSRFTGKELKNAKGKPLTDLERFYVAAQETLEGPTPGASQLMELGRRGGQPVPGALNPFAIKPGTEKGIGKTAIKLVSPFRFTYNKTKKTEGRPERAARPERASRERPERAERAAR